MICFGLDITLYAGLIDNEGPCFGLFLIEISITGSGVIFISVFFFGDG